MVNVYLLPADEGDFIWVRYGDKENYTNILIDGGTKNNGAEYAEVIEFIESNGETIEAIILTHIDYDHLQGAVDGISRVSSETLKKIVKRILFNTCRGILRQQGQAIDKNEYAEDQIKGNIFSGGYGIEDAIAFVELLKKKEIDDRLIDYIISGSKLTWDKGAEISFISPGKNELANFIKKWEPYCRKRKTILYTSNSKFIQNNLKILMKEKLGSDSSTNNGASIAFIFEYQDIKLAFLGDAKPSACIKGIKALELNQPYKVDILKLSHHGSKYNTSDSLLKKLKTTTYMLSTNGNGQTVPSKVVIAHLLKNADKDEIQIACNYDWWETVYHRKYFTDDDKVDFLDTNKLKLLLLDNSGIEVKKGLTIYGDW